MEFQEIRKEASEKWDGFVLESSPESFLQSFGWGEFQNSVGKEVFRYAVMEAGRILAVALAVEHRLAPGFKYWYLPRGPIMSDAEEGRKAETLEFLLAHLRAEAVKRKVIFLRMDPCISKSDGDFLTRAGLRLVSGSVQPKDTLVLDLCRSEEELLGEMKQKTRYNIRLAEKKEVRISREDFSEEAFGEFWELVRETSERDGIVSHSREYYYKMLEVLGKKEGMPDMRLYAAKHQGKTIAANIFLIFGSYSVYLHGASSNKFRNLMAPYLLQWRQIQDAKAAGCRRYDFWGITLETENPKWSGITRFKKGFGGKEVSYAGVYDLPINSFVYNLYIKLGRRG